MSDMTSLFKAQEVTYRTEVFENFNQIEKYKDDLEDIFGETSPVQHYALNASSWHSAAPHRCLR